MRPVEVHARQPELAEDAQQTSAALGRARVATVAAERRLELVLARSRCERTQRAIGGGERWAQVELRAPDRERELALGRTPREVGLGAAAEQRIVGPPGGGSKRDEAVEAGAERRVASQRAPGDDREPLRPPEPATSCSSAARRRAARPRPRRARDSPLVSSSPTTPAKPSPRRSTRRRCPTARPLSAVRGRIARELGAQPLPERPSSPSTRSSPERVGQSARMTTRGSTTPFQRLRSRRTAMSCGSRARRASALGGEPNATPRAREAPVTSVKRACWRSSPIPATPSTRAAGTSSVGWGLRGAERP